VGRGESWTKEAVRKHFGLMVTMVVVGEEA
jgi:hypothetical protein